MYPVLPIGYDKFSTQEIWRILATKKKKKNKCSSKSRVASRFIVHTAGYGVLVGLYCI